MAKVQKLITLDIEVSKRLDKVKNASGLINTVLKKHFGALLDLKNCEHQWSNCFSTAGGLCKECAVCGNTEFISI